jgi:hypothetical protein
MWYVKMDLFQHRVTTLFTPIQTIREAGLGACSGTYILLELQLRFPQNVHYKSLFICYSMYISIPRGSWLILGQLAKLLETLDQ